MNQEDKKPAIIIQADIREIPSEIPSILEQKYGIKILTESRKTGDYLINKKIVIERKTALDFTQSMINGRLFKQTAMMKNAFDYSLVIIEGDITKLSNVHPHAITGALISLSLAWQMPVLFSKDAEDTALLLWLIGNQNTKPVSELSHRPGRRPKRLYKRQLYILQGLPGTGPNMAIRLLEHFKSVEAVMAASEQELMSVRGLGRKKASKIR